MEAVILLIFIPALLWLLIIRPQQRRLREHQQLVVSLQEGDEVVLTAGIFGRITRLGPEELSLEVAPGTELRVARQAVLRRVEHTVSPTADDLDDLEGTDDRGEADDDQIDSTAAGGNNAGRPHGDDPAP